MDNLVNPLRSKPLRTLPTQEESLKESVRETPRYSETKAIVTAPPITTPFTAMVPHSIQVNNNPELKKALELLAKHGIETSAPKVNYIKHSYEIEEDLHKEFHAMYPLLGFKHVKTAINDAIRMWCKENRSEYNRRKGS